MKVVILLFVAWNYFILIPPPASVPAFHPGKDSLFGIFVGRTPCVEIAKDLKVPVKPDCFKIKWKISLYHEPGTHVPTIYRIDCTFHRQSILQGTWSITRGSRSNPGATIYRLNPNESLDTMYLLKGDDNVLFFLDKHKNMLMGNKEFSYTLNRTDMANL